MKKILIIDDDKDIRKIFTILMKKKGYTVATLPGSSGADEFIKDFKPNIVLTDHNLGVGEEEGYILAMRLKEHGIKVVLMSADFEIGSKAFKNDLAFCQKPIRLETLLNTLNEVAHA